MATAEQGYIDIGRRCGVAEPSVENVKSWLACNSQRWLLIIDNADNPAIDYSRYKPQGRRGDILLTTRNPECILHQTVGSETLEGLEPDLARELLLRATLIPEDLWKEKADAAIAVVQTLGSHTLAIIQAGAYIRSRLCTLEQYPTVFEQQKRQLLTFHSQQMTSTYGNVYATFEVSAEYLQNSENQEHLDALDFLHTVAFMHNNGISETIFQMASEYTSELHDEGLSRHEMSLSLSVRHVAMLPDYAQQGWSDHGGRMRWRKACLTLESLSLITMHEDGSSITISAHPLVHAWAKERQDDQDWCAAWQSAATILALSCQNDYNYRPFLVSLHPHMRACVSHDFEKATQRMSDVEAAQLLLPFAHALDAMFEDSLLSSLVQCIALRLQKTDVADQPMILPIKALTGRVFMRQGKYTEALEVLREVDDSRAQALAEDHPVRLALQHELARAYVANRQIDKAIKLLKYIIKVEEERLVEDHPHKLASQHELAGAYKANGQIDKAVELLKHVVRVDEKLPKDHPDKLTSQHELARAYRANGQIDKAVELLEHVVRVEEKLPEDHPYKLATQHELAKYKASITKQRP